MTNGKTHIILASASPRRREILTDLGVKFTVLTADTDESSDITDPIELTKHLASIKGRAVYDLLCRRGEQEGAVIISADTVVACDGKILGKPKNADEARAMLTRLSGREHTVATGVALTVEGVTRADCYVTRVRVCDIPSEQIDRYIATGEPFDKAGGYGIQGEFCKWISGIDGCYFSVVGLPVSTLNNLFFECTGKYLGD